MPTTSVVMPLYNCRAYVAEAVRSVLDQTDADIELIIWDDGSADDGAAVALGAADGDARVRLVRAEHRGLAGALREAFAQTRGTFVAQCDADDRLWPRAVALTRRCLEKHPTAGLAYTRQRRIDVAGNALGPGQHDKVPFDANRMLVNFMTQHFRLYRRDAYEVAGGWNPSYPAATDYDMCLRMAERFPVRHVPQVLYDYRVRPDSISGAARGLQRQSALRAVNESLVRRGQADRFRVILSDDGTFKLTALGK